MNTFLRRNLSWEVGHHGDGSASPLEWVPAQVPGSVQLDWARAKKWPEYWKGDNFKAYAWMEDVYWTYRAKLDAGNLADTERLFFTCRGIDYRFEVRVGGDLLFEQEGMFTPFELDLTEPCRAGKEIRITVHPAPKSRPSPPDRAQADHSCKPAVSYGWDFHPRLIPLGIWDETCLEVRPAARLTEADLAPALAPDFSEASLTLKISWTENTSGGIRWSLFNPDGKLCFQEEAAVPGKDTFIRTIPAPRLWWPHDQGEPALYRSVVEWLDDSGRLAQTIERRVGFRRMRLVMNEGAWLQPSSFPKTRSNPPITLEVNGRSLFCKGTNWVGPHIFPGAIGREDYRVLLSLARDGNLNLLRCWGGAIVNKESFFELCDQLGLMVWQEFPLACNFYPDDPAYLRILDHESRSIIRRLRAHPCLAIWCGGNELFNVWSGMTDQSLPLRLLNRNCYDLDPGTPFLPTSPVMGMGHGHYVFRDPLSGEEAGELFQKAENSAYTEFGCPGPAPVEVLESFLPPGELFPPRPGTAWQSHHAFGAWMDASHLYLDVIGHYAGPSTTLEELVAKGQWLQGEGYKALFEEARRQKPAASMALNWCFNEPWPAAANNSLISWPAHPKPAYEAVRQACRPVLASARIPKFLWREGEVFQAELWLLSDAPFSVAAGVMEAWIELGSEKIKVLTWSFSVLAAQANQLGPRLNFLLPKAETDRLVLRLHVPGSPGMDSDYQLSYAPGVVPKAGSDIVRTMNL